MIGGAEGATMADNLLGAQRHEVTLSIESGPVGTTPPTLLEREIELDALRAAIDDARCGVGSVVVIQGPSGAGKTALLEAAQSQAQAAGLRVLASRGRDLEQRVALGVAVDLLAAPVAGADPQERERLFTGPAGWAAALFTGPAPSGPALPDATLVGLCWLTANLATDPRPVRPEQPIPAPFRPVVVIVDDTQWVDAPSLRYLAMLADRAERTPVALIVAARDDVTEDGAGLPPALFTGRRRVLLTPVPLSFSAVSTLVTAAVPDAEPGVAAAVTQASGGNPFFVQELLVTLQDQRRTDGPPLSAEMAANLVPATVLRSVVTRLARLPEPARRLAETLAVLGDGTPLPRAATHAGLGLLPAGRAADVLAGARLLRPGSPLAFTHALIGAAIRADLPAFALSQAHRRAADLLANDGESAEKVAGHLLATDADGTPGTVEVLREAAGHGLARGDARAAGHLLHRALAEPLPAGLRGGLLVDLARAELLAGNESAEATLEDSLRLIGHDVADLRVEALSVLAQARIAHGDVLGAAAAAAEALDLLDPAHPAWPDGLTNYLMIATFHPSLQPDVERRLAPLLRRARAGQPPGHPGLLSQVAFQLALTDTAPATVGRIADLARAQDPLVDPGAAGRMGLLAAFVVRAYIMVGDLASAEVAADAAVAAARQRGNRLAHGTASYHRALVSYHRGALTQALADVEAARAATDAGWVGGASWTAALRAEIHLERGDRRAARSALRSDGREAADAMGQALFLHARARLALAEHDADTALTCARAAGRHLRQIYHIDHPGILPWRSTAALAAHRLGDHATAQRLAEEALARARATAVPAIIGAALRVAGLVAHPRSDLGLLTEAASVLGQTPAHLEHTHALYDLGAALRRAGHRNAARQPLQQALALAEGLRAQPLADGARAELRILGFRPRRSSMTGIEALTAAEQRVALLALHGHSNSHLAEALSITTKTVESHLAHAYRKLGISNRRQLHDAFGPGSHDSH
jgi:DNA-binding CsgD family transcriptional regulator